MNYKLKEAEKSLERRIDDIKEKDFMNISLKEELERKNG